ncbi:MAG: hypothetical protein AB7V45_04995 [Candidatus Krumholzibacteriia bacterium]
MDIIIALVFVSVTLVIAGLVFFFSRLFEGDFEHGERLSLLPLADDEGAIESAPDLSDDKPDEVGFNGSAHSIAKPADPGP